MFGIKIRDCMTWGSVSSLALLVSACGDGEAGLRSDGPNDATMIQSYGAASDLPDCTPGRRGQVFYVSNEQQLYVCATGYVPIHVAAGGPGSLVAVTDASSSQCANGGIVVHVGADADGDGVLDVGEIAASTAVCDGEPGPAGADGEPGGSCHVVDNGDGSVTIACDDGSEATVSDGENGAASPPLVHVESEPSGDNCVTGGHRIQIGLDADGDGELDAAEVTSTEYACAPLKVLDGQLYVHTQEQMEALKGVYAILGTVTIVGDLDLSALTHLERIDGYLTIYQNNTLTNLDALSGLTSLAGQLQIQLSDALTNVDGLAGLTNIQGYLYLSRNAALTNVDGLGQLVSVEGGLSLTDNDALTNLDGLASLSSVTGSLMIDDNAALTNIDGLGALTILNLLDLANNDALTNVDGLSGLTTAGDLNIYQNDALTDVDGLSGLTSARTLYLSTNGSLTDIAGLSALTSVDDLYLFDTALTNVNALSSLTQVTHLISIVQNDFLTSLQGFSALQQVGDVNIHTNPSLPQCDVDALLSGISVTGSVITTANNGVCPP